MSFSGDRAPCYVPPGRRPDTQERAFNLDGCATCLFLSKDSELRTECRGMQCRQLLIELLCSREVDVVLVGRGLPQHVKLRQHLVREGTQH